MTEKKSGSGFSTFVLMWLGQIVSLLGSAMTAFALGVWVYQQNRSVTQFALITVIAGLPGLVISPLVGALVDRWNRRWTLIMSDAAAAVLTGVTALLLYYDNLQIWHIYIIAALGAVFGAFQWPAFMASLTMLIKREQYGRVQGMMQFGNAGATIAAPALAGFMVLTIGLEGVLVIDLVTFLFAVTMLFIAKIPQPKQTASGAQGRGSIWKEAGFGWTYIKERGPLVKLLLFFAAVNLVTSMCGVALLPMLLGFAQESGAGTVMGLVGVGMLGGGLIMSATGGPKDKMLGVLGVPLIYAVAFVMVGLKPWLWLVGLGVILWYIVLPIMNACSQVIWQSKVAPDVQGRVFAIRRMIAQFTVPIGDFSAGPLSDRVFGPMLLAGGALASTQVGEVIGVGEGRGIGLLFVITSVFLVVISLFGFASKDLRRIDETVPDAVAENPEDMAEPEPEKKTQKETEGGEAAAEGAPAGA